MANMSFETEEGGHRVMRPYAISEFWDHGKACGALDAHNRVDVYVPGLLVPSFTFASSHEPGYSRALHALETAYERGRSAKAREIKAALNIKE